MRSDAATIRKTTRLLTANQPKPQPVVKGRRHTIALTPLQRRQKDSANYRDLSRAVRHLTYHVFPHAAAADAIEWNLNELKKRWHIFSGLKVLGINHSDHTITPDDLLHRFALRGMTWDRVVIRENNPGLGEVLTWIPSLELLFPELAGQNEIVFSAHAKGVKYGPMPPLIRQWTDVMYSANLDDMERVHQSLEWFSATGAFRCRYRRTKGCRHGWFYSGAFWWWRLADIAARNWREVSQWYAGREVWIGNQIERHESDCLFMDSSRSPYLKSYWNSVINPRWKKYQQERLIHAR